MTKNDLCIISAATAKRLFLGHPTIFFFYFPMQMYTAFFLGAVTGVIVNDKTLSSGCLIQVGLRLDLLPAALFLKL